MQAAQFNDSSQICLNTLRKTVTSTWDSPSTSAGLLAECIVSCLGNPIRIRLIIFWSCLVVISVAWCYVSPFLSFHTSSKRKFFHFAISAVYVSGTIWDFEFLCVAAVVALVAFVASEACRLFGPRPLRRILNDAFASLLDAKDQGTFIFSHFYLLLGMSLPVWIDYLTSPKGEHTALSYAGVITVGVGDSFAAIIGRAVGRHRWPRRNRTLEGSLAMLFSQLVTFEVIHLLDRSAFGAEQSAVWSLRFKWFIHSVLTSLAEAYVQGSDNVMVPLFSVMILSVFTRGLSWLHSCSVLKFNSGEL